MRNEEPDWPGILALGICVVLTVAALIHAWL